MERKVFSEDIESALNAVINSGKHVGMFPAHLSLFGISKNDNTKRAIIHVPCSEFMESEKTKKNLVEFVLPEIGIKAKEDYDIYAVIFVSEINGRMMSADDDIPENYKDLPISFEGVSITIQTDDRYQMLVYKIEKKGMKVITDKENNSSEIVDDISLELMTCTENGNDDDDDDSSIEGLFSNLLKNFK